MGVDQKVLLAAGSAIILNKDPRSPLGGRKERIGSVSGWQVVASSLLGLQENLGHLLCLDSSTSSLHWSKVFAKHYLVLVRRFQKQEALIGVLVIWWCRVSLFLCGGRENHQLRNRHPDLGQYMSGYLRSRCRLRGTFSETFGWLSKPLGPCLYPP